MRGSKNILLAGIATPTPVASGAFTYAKLKTTALALAKTFTELVGLALLMGVVFYGLRMILARGDEAAFRTAKTGLTNAMIGTLIVYGAHTIIATLYNAVHSVGR